MDKKTAKSKVIRVPGWLVPVVEGAIAAYKEKEEAGRLAGLDAGLDKAKKALEEIA